MSAYGSTPKIHRAEDPGRISIPFVIAAALLIGAGLFSAMYWLVTFNWWYFAGFAPLLAGALMLFDPRAGASAAT